MKKCMSMEFSALPDGSRENPLSHGGNVKCFVSAEEMEYWFFVSSFQT